MDYKYPTDTKAATGGSAPVNPANPSGAETVGVAADYDFSATNGTEYFASPLPGASTFNESTFPAGGSQAPSAKIFH